MVCLVDYLAQDRKEWTTGVLNTSFNRFIWYVYAERFALSFLCARFLCRGDFLGGLSKMWPASRLAWTTAVSASS